MNDSINRKMQQAGWVFPDWVWDYLSDYERTFVANEFTGQRSLDYYLKRLEAIGFKGMDTVLDAGCGMGQWSVALSFLNEQVNGIDVNLGRLLIAKLLAAGSAKNNCSFRYASAENLPYPSESFDGVFCYGVFMFTNMPKTLSEFNRVLKPGGKVYFNVNSTGWYAHQLFDLGLRKKNYSLARAGLGTVARTILRRKRNIVVGKRWLLRQIEQAGLQLVGVDSEGRICIDTSVVKPEPAYHSEYYGMPAILEVLARKEDIA